MAERAHLRAPAKVNLRLEVLGLRPDGYHEIRSWIYPVGLWDEIIVERTGGEFELLCDHPAVPREDLCLRAARAFYQRTGLKGGARVVLKKRIPVGSGLGGGSSDAAATIKGLCALWGVELSEEEILELGSQVGSDVPFFLRGKPALVGGRGERILEDLPPLKAFLIILFPGKGISTEEVYRRLPSLTKPGEGNKIIEEFPPKNWKGFLYNALEPVAEGILPEVRELKEALMCTGAEGALMSGSGSAVFGIYEKEEVAKEAFGKLKAFPWEVFLVRTF